MGQIPIESERIVIRKIIRFFRSAGQSHAPLKSGVEPCCSGPRGPDSNKGWKASNLRSFHVTVAFILILIPQKARRVKRTVNYDLKKTRDSDFQIACRIGWLWRKENILRRLRLIRIVPGCRCYRLDLGLATRP